MLVGRQPSVLLSLRGFAMFLRRLAVLAAMGVVVAACGDKEDPAVATTVEPGVSLTQTGVVNSQVNVIPTVTVKDQRGQPMGNTMVRWSVTAGAGRIGNDSIRTDASGVASLGSWVLGTRSGANIVSATVAALTPVTFTASAGPAAPTRLVRVSVDNQRVTVNSAVPVPLAARVVDEYDNPVAAVPVRFEVTRGGGRLASVEAVSDTAGLATAGTWTLGQQLGPNTVRASAVGLGAVQGVEFNAFGLAGPPTTMRVAVGDNQVGSEGGVLPFAPAVRVTDGFGNNVGGVPVTFTAAARSGSLATTSAVTDSASGLAFAGQWTLGPDSVQSVVAQSTVLPTQGVTFRARLGVARYNIDVRFVGAGGSPAQRASVQRAAGRWQEIIVGSVHKIFVDRNIASACGNQRLPAVRDTITDLLVFVILDSIDGPGRVLGGATPCLVNAVTRLSLVGYTVLDTADLSTLEARNMLDDVVTHEIGHIIGIGTLWEEKRLLVTGLAGASPCTSTDDPYFSGALARQRFADAGGTTFYPGIPVPVENRGGSGTACGHWREAQFGRELMQGFAKAGGMPLSAITAASLADLGYPVSFSRVNPFQFLPSLLAARENADPTVFKVNLSNDILDADIFGIDPKSGSWSLVRPRRFR
jgi:hypothetical protein